VTTPSLFYREIPLTQGQVALVDTEDYDWLNQWKWHINGSGYAQRRSGPFLISMHREIMGLKRGDPRQVDHKNGERLDDRRTNLRITDQTGNTRNRKMPCVNKCGYKGAFFHKNKNRWKAQIKINGKGIYLGTFHTPEEAHAAYCAAAQRLFGDFARFN